jgi:hypothetical protein
MSAPSNVCNTCLGSGEVLQMHAAVVDGRYRTLQGFVPCPRCGDPEAGVQQRPRLGPNRRSVN